jgi:cell division transport system permease protein
MLASAVALIANTLRMGMFARRKEIGIMRLVGATNWRIRVPFLIEGLVESLLGAAAAVFALFLVKVVFIDRLRGEIKFFPLVQNHDVLALAPWIVIAATLIAVIAGTIGMRRFLDV